MQAGAGLRNRPQDKAHYCPWQVWEETSKLAQRAEVDMQENIVTILLAGAIYIALCTAVILRLRLGVGLLLIGLTIIQPFPTKDVPWDLYAYIGLGTTLVVTWLSQQALQRRFQLGNGTKPGNRNRLSIQMAQAITLFLLVCIASFPLSIINNWEQPLGNRIYLYARGLLPFLYLLLFFIVRDLRLGQEDLRRFGLLVFAVCAVYGLRSYWLFFPTFVRITYIDVRFVFPFPVLAADLAYAYFLFSKTTLGASLWAVLFLFFTGSVIPTYTKSQILALAAGVLLITVIGYARDGWRRAARVAIPMGLMALLVAWVMLEEFSVFSLAVVSTWQLRLDDASSYEGRGEEIQIALQNFQDNPLFGKGLGFQYTLSMDAGSGETVGYVHNAIAYLLMTLGLVGFVMYLRIVWIWLSMVRETFSANLSGMESLLVGIHGSLLSLFVYSLLFATVRTIQQNVLIASSLAIVCGILGDKGRFSKALPAG